MTIGVKLLKNKESNSDGYAIVLRVSHKQVRREKEIGRAFEKDFDFQTGNVLESHPDFEVLAPKILNYKLKARKIIASGITNPDEAMWLVFGENENIVRFKDYSKKYVAELREMAAKFEKLGEIKKRNNLLGTAASFENAINQLTACIPELTINNVTYNDLMRFRKRQELLGNSKSTVHLYLRTIRSLYNKALNVYNIKASEQSPFKGVFDGLKKKSFAQRKKYISKESVEKLENMEHFTQSASKYTDLWLLQFYFAGVDLIDIYFLKKNQIRKGRVYFERGKTDVPVDLLVTDKAKKIIEKWKCTDKNSEWLFPWRKDHNGYKTFSRRMYCYLQKAQEMLNIEVLPAGGNLGSKVARHTFATIGKQKGIDAEILRELMGHERDEVDNYYKDRFPEEVRDKALLDIIC